MTVMYWPEDDVYTYEGAEEHAELVGFGSINPPPYRPISPSDLDIAMPPWYDDDVLSPGTWSDGLREIDDFDWDSDVAEVEVKSPDEDMQEVEAEVAESIGTISEPSLHPDTRSACFDAPSPALDNLVDNEIAESGDAFSRSSPDISVLTSKHLPGTPDSAPTPLERAPSEASIARTDGRTSPPLTAPPRKGSDDQNEMVVLGTGRDDTEQMDVDKATSPHRAEGDLPQSHAHLVSGDEPVVPATASSKSEPAAIEAATIKAIVESMDKVVETGQVADAEIQDDTGQAGVQLEQETRVEGGHSVLPHRTSPHEGPLTLDHDLEEPHHISGPQEAILNVPVNASSETKHDEHSEKPSVTVPAALPSEPVNTRSAEALASIRASIFATPQPFAYPDFNAASPVERSNGDGNAHALLYGLAEAAAGQPYLPTSAPTHINKPDQDSETLTNDSAVQELPDIRDILPPLPNSLDAVAGREGMAVAVETELEKGMNAGTELATNHTAATDAVPQLSPPRSPSVQPTRDVSAAESSTSPVLVNTDDKNEETEIDTPYAQSAIPTLGSPQKQAEAPDLPAPVLARSKTEPETASKENDVVTQETSNDKPHELASRSAGPESLDTLLSDLSDAPDELDSPTKPLHPHPLPQSPPKLNNLQDDDETAEQQLLRETAAANPESARTSNTGEILKPDSTSSDPLQSDPPSIPHISTPAKPTPKPKPKPLAKPRSKLGLKRGRSARLKNAESSRKKDKDFKPGTGSSEDEDELASPKGKRVRKSAASEKKGARVKDGKEKGKGKGKRASMDGADESEHEDDRGEKDGDEQEVLEEGKGEEPPEADDMGDGNNDEQEQDVDEDPDPDPTPHKPLARTPANPKSRRSAPATTRKTRADSRKSTPALPRGATPATVGKGTAATAVATPPASGATTPYVRSLTPADLFPRYGKRTTRGDTKKMTPAKDAEAQAVDAPVVGNKNTTNAAGAKSKGTGKRKATDTLEKEGTKRQSRRVSEIQEKAKKEKEVAGKAAEKGEGSKKTAKPDGRRVKKTCVLQ
jgi:hypothetical protein